MLHTVYLWFESLVYIIPLLRKDDIIIAPSWFAKESFSRVSDKLNIQIIPYSLDIKHIQDSSSRYLKDPDKKIITFMGRLTKEKGIETLIKCMPKIISRVNNAQLNIIGPLSGELITDHPKSTFVKVLEGEVKKLRLANRVHFMGLKLGLEKYKILSESDIFINPTTAEEETFGIANIEALSCGVPVIATKWAGNREIVMEGENGYLVNVDYDRNEKPKVDTEQLISLIVKVLRNKRLNLRLKENAMETARKFDYRKVMPKLVKLLKKKARFKVENRWELIKNKKVTDFKHLFNRDFLFFLYYAHIFKTETYASLYRRIIHPEFLKNKLYPTPKRTINIKNNEQKGIYDKIRRNLLDFLLLKFD